MGIDSLARAWWAVALRGIAAILFGAVTLILPAMTLAALVLLFGAYALFEGVLNVIGAVRAGENARPSWVSLLAGLVSIAAGVVTLVLPGPTELALLYVIAAWAIVAGLFEVISARPLRRRIQGGGSLGLNGLLSIVFGVLTMLMPGAGAVSIGWLIGAYAIASGVLQLRLAVQLRRWQTWRRHSGFATAIDATSDPARSRR